MGSGATELIVWTNFGRAAPSSPYLNWICSVWPKPEFSLFRVSHTPLSVCSILSIPEMGLFSLAHTPSSVFFVWPSLLGLAQGWSWVCLVWPSVGFGSVRSGAWWPKSVRPSLDLGLWKDNARPKLGMIRPCWTQKSRERNFARLYQSPGLLLDLNFFTLDICSTQQFTEFWICSIQFLLPSTLA